MVLCFNIVASRLALRFVPADGDGVSAEAQRWLATQSVERHMRIVEKVLDEARLSVTAPSEPVLAAAAALEMLALGKGATTEKKEVAARYGKVWRDFRELCLPELDGSTFEGATSGLVARAVLVAAWDAAKLPHMLALVQPISTTAPTNDHQLAEVFGSPLPLRDFVDGLARLDDISPRTLLACTDQVCRHVATHLYPGSDSPVGMTMSDPPKVDAYVNFTHFDVLPVSVPSVSCDYLWYCWKRGVAIQMADGQPGVDGIIPVFVGDLQRRFTQDPSRRQLADLVEDESGASQHMIFIAWKAQNREKPADPANTKYRHSYDFRGPPLLPAACSDAGDATHGGNSAALTERGLFSMLLEFGTQKPVRGTNGARAAVFQVSTNEPKSVLADSRGATNTADCKTSGAHGDLATESSRTANTADQPGAALFNEEADFAYINIRGLAEDVYPCLSKLGVREEIARLLASGRPDDHYNDDNCVRSPLYTPALQPSHQGHIH